MIDSSYFTSFCRKPTTFATCIFEDQKKKLLFCLPGNPVSATVTFHLYVLPALKTIAGFKEPFPTEISAKVRILFYLLINFFKYYVIVVQIDFKNYLYRLKQNYSWTNDQNIKEECFLGMKKIVSL